MKATLKYSIWGWNFVSHENVWTLQIYKLSRIVSLIIRQIFYVLVRTIPLKLTFSEDNKKSIWSLDLSIATNCTCYTSMTGDSS
jgi:hypothetical protein